MTIPKLKIAVLLFAVMLCPYYTFGQEVREISLDIYIDQAIKHNPRIQAAFHQWQSAKHAITRVQSLDDPVFSYAKFGEEIQTRVGPQEQKYAVAQNIPFSGKRKLKGKIQAKHAAMLEQKYQAVINEVVKDVKFVYFDLFWVDQAIQMNEEEKSILEKLEKVAQRKYESNQVTQQDVIKVQVELSKIIKKILLLKQNRLSMVARMNALLHRAHDTPVPRVTKLKEPTFLLALEELIAKLQSDRQEIIAGNLLLEKAEYETQLAKKDYWPDMTWGVEYIEIGGGSTSLANDGDDAWMGKVSINVPVWFHKLKANVREKEEVLQSARQEKEALDNEFVFEAQDTYFQMKAYKDIVLLYETALIPQAQQAFESSQTGFETGVISFLDWLDTERTYLQTRLAYYKAITDYHKSIAHLERIVGGDWQGGLHDN